MTKLERGAGNYIQTKKGVWDWGNSDGWEAFIGIVAAEELTKKYVLKIVCK